MSPGKYALITGGSRGSAGDRPEAGATGRPHRHQLCGNEAAAKRRWPGAAAGADGFIIQADVTTGDIHRLFNTVQAEFGKLDIFVSNPARDPTSAPPLTLHRNSGDGVRPQANAFSGRAPPVNC
jgi:NAD(P)-dependent dehydrogenase (short-subunit alcohol dehydrogenase family)